MSGRMSAASRRGPRAHRGICRKRTCSRDVLLNDQPAGKIALGTVDGVITRHGIQGRRDERAFTFDASRPKAGTNVLKIIAPSRPINNGIVYDELRLELDEATAMSVNF